LKELAIVFFVVTTVGQPKKKKKKLMIQFEQIDEFFTVNIVPNLKRSFCFLG